MPRPEKVQAVADIKERFEGAQAVFVTEYRGITVKQLAELRRSLRKTGADYKVVKMTLARRATDGMGIAGLEEKLEGPTALAFANEDAVATAKALRDFARDNDRLVLKAGVMGGDLLRPEQIGALAEIEPREVLLSKIAGAAKAPLAKMAGLLSAFNRNAASMFSQLLDKKESDTPPAAAADEAKNAEPAEEPAAEAPAAEPAEVPAAEPAEEEPAADAPASEEPTAEPAEVTESVDAGAGEAEPAPIESDETESASTEEE
jgi:large subunit ribosomal protein L10